LNPCNLTHCKFILRTLAGLIGAAKNEIIYLRILFKVYLLFFIFSQPFPTLVPWFKNEKLGQIQEK
jgi:hypothetical protein